MWIITQQKTSEGINPIRINIDKNDWRDLNKLHHISTEATSNAGRRTQKTIENSIHYEGLAKHHFQSFITHQQLVELAKERDWGWRATQKLCEATKIQKKSQVVISRISNSVDSAYRLIHLMCDLKSDRAWFTIMPKHWTIAADHDNT